MDDSTIPPIQPDPALPGQQYSDRFWLILLLSIVALVRFCQITQTELTARDGISYVRSAWRLETEPWDEVIRTSLQHPGYTFAIYLVGKPMRALLPQDWPLAMQWACQLVSAIASLGLAVAMYLLGRFVFDRRVGFWGALLFQLLPSPGRMMPDALGEPLFLCLFLIALVFAVRGVQYGLARDFGFCGVFVGLAYLTRTEGLLILFVTGLVLLGLQTSARWRRPTLITMRNLCCLVAACAVFVAPFMWLIGGVSLKASLRHMQNAEGWQLPERRVQVPLEVEVDPPIEPRVVGMALPLAMWEFGWDIQAKDRTWWAAKAVFWTLQKTFFYLGWPLALVGMWAYRRRFNEVPGLWIPFLCGALLVPLLYRLAQTNGYVGQRHVVLILSGGCYFAVLGMGVMAAWLGRRARVEGGWLSLATLLILVGLCLPKTLERLHGQREGFREAGLWLAQNAPPGDFIVDPMAWAKYHAGRVFTAGREDLPKSEEPTCYVVMEESKNSHPHLYYVLDPAKELIKTTGTQEIYRKKVEKQKDVQIVIYRVPRAAPEFFTTILPRGQGH